jgi:hypothetical protein
MKRIKEDNKLMSILKVEEISRFVCDTNQGTLKLQLRKGDTKYRFILDAVPLEEEQNNEVMELLYGDKEEKITKPITNGKPKA